MLAAERRGGAAAVDAWLGFDSAQGLTPELISAVRQTCGQDPKVRVTYLDAFGGGREEVSLAHQHGMAVVLCANSTSAAEVSGTLEDGLRYAEGQALIAREKLGAPEGTLIVVDVEAEWSPSGDWIAGCVYGMLAKGYQPGLYGSLRSARTTNALLRAQLAYYAVRERLVLWSATPTTTVWDGMPQWRADHLPGLRTVGWQFAESIAVPGGTVDLDLWDASTPGLWMAPRPEMSTPLRHQDSPSAPGWAAHQRELQQLLATAIHALQSAQHLLA